MQTFGRDKVPMFLAVDVEPDQNLDVGPRGPVSWTGLPAMRRHLEDLRGSLEEATGSPLRVGWYIRMDPQIEALCGTADCAADRMSEVPFSADGDYLGLHVHATVWDADKDCWVRANDNPGLRLEHLKVGLEAFATRMGEQPLRHRFTSGLIRDPAIAVLAKAGVKVDLTSEPRFGPHFLSRTGRGAYQSASDPPLTVVRESSTSWLPHGRLPWRTLARKAWRPLAGWYLSPYLRYLSPTEYWDEMTRSIANMQTPYVSIAFRTDAAGNSNDERSRDLLEALLTHPLVRDLRFADPLELVPTTSATKTFFAND